MSRPAMPQQDPGDPELPIGDLALYDRFLPSLDAGNWVIEVAHDLDPAKVETGPLGATQSFVVSAPQFAIDPSEVVTVYPPPGSSARYAEVLPHVVLREPLLPWERPMKGSRDHPWLALLVLSAEELVGGGASPTGAQVTTVGAFLAPAADVFKPPITRADDVDPSESCTIIEISTQTFAAVMPRLDETDFLAHCRRSNVADKSIRGVAENGLFSVVVANRFPAAPRSGHRPVRSVAHLVSLEGLETLLVDAPNFSTSSRVALISLKSWTFLCEADAIQDFRACASRLVASETVEAAPRPDLLLLRLPQDVAEGSDPATAEARGRVAAGYVPMAFRTRTGDDTIGWYRGPLAPVLPAPLQKTVPFPSADAALIYLPTCGVFDTSLAVAWTAGRGAALADKGFGQGLLEFRRRLHRLVDALLVRLRGGAFSPSDIASVAQDRLVQDDFLARLDAGLVAKLGRPRRPPPAGLSPPRPAAIPGTGSGDPKAALARFLAEPDVQERVRAAVGDGLSPIARWLARLMLLEGLPFNLLVPDARLLPPESLRFFYLDENWIDAAIDGALSIGLESTRDTLVHQMTAGLVREAAKTAAAALRAEATGVDPPAGTGTFTSGFLLCSGLVAGWPNLAVRPRLKDSSHLKILRLDHLSKGILIGLFAGAPDDLDLAEPQEGLRFGVDDDHRIALRQPTADPQTPLGTPRDGAFLPLAATCLRDATNRVLRLKDGPGSLVPALAAALGIAEGDFGPADFALQMVKSPESLRFLISGASS